MFRSHPFQNEDFCDQCGWAFERGPGHWLGGTEINMLITFPAGLLISLPLVLLTGGAAWALALGAVATVAVSLVTYRRSRCLFFAIDHLLDPVPDASTGGPPPGGGGGAGGDEPPPTPRPDQRVPPSAEPVPQSAKAPVDEDVGPDDAPRPPPRRRREPVRAS